MSKKTYCSIDLVDIKQKLTSGKLAAKINMFGYQVCFLYRRLLHLFAKLMMLPENYSFRPKGHWEPEFVYTSHSVDHPMEGHDGWACSECGWTTDERHDYCICGADMRESNKATKTSNEFKELLDTL